MRHKQGSRSLRTEFFSELLFLMSYSGCQTTLVQFEYVFSDYFGV